ncbi:MAG: hypothetical protein ABR538_11850 [Candidatus Binatia bacterium]
MYLQVIGVLIAGLVVTAGNAFGEGEIPIPHNPVQDEIPQPHAPWIPTSVHKASEIRVFKYDGSRQCGFEPGVPVEEMAKELKSLGVAVLSKEKLAAPIMVASACGLPTGWANVYTIALRDLAKVEADTSEKGRFSVWLFEKGSIFVAKYDGSLQCMDGGVPLDQMEKELTAVDIMVRSRRSMRDGLRHMTVCGATKGRMNVYEIAPSSYPAARVLGFMLMGKADSQPSALAAGDDLFPWPW